MGPGAPDLLTLRAVEALRRVDVILAAASPRNDYSRALETARPHLRPDVRLQRLEFPMTHDKATLRAAWEKAAGITRDVLRGGENAAFLTIGDPLVYSTFGYLLKTLRQLEDVYKRQPPPVHHTLTSRSSLPRVARPWSPEPAGVKRESRENRERTRRRKARRPASFMCHWQREGRKPGAEPEYLPWTVASGLSLIHILRRLPAATLALTAAARTLPFLGASLSSPRRRGRAGACLLYTS